MKFGILILLCGCASFDDLRYEGELQTKKLTAELRSLETKEDLQKALPKLKKRFNRIADLAIRASSFEGSDEVSAVGEALFAEMARLYEMPGGRELIENAQVEAVSRLKKQDLFR